MQGTARAREKESINFLGFTLKGYTVKKLIFHAVIGIATALGVLRQELTHARQGELERKQVELAAREEQCEKILMQMLQERRFPPSTRTAGIEESSQNEEWRKILMLPQPSSPADIVRDLQADWRVSEKRNARKR
jgi:hypothetical protein